MNPETKQCQNCKNQFTIEPEDFEFYAKIKVPAPTFCPECRFIRKTIFRNEKSLYKRKCDVPGHKEIAIGLYSLEKPVVVYDQKYWWSDEWDPMSYGKDYDFNKPFFEQFNFLIKQVPWPNIVITNSVNSDYCHSILNSKNCYLLSGTADAEDSAYGAQITGAKNSFDIDYIFKSELSYELIGCENCYKLFFSYFSAECSHSMFLLDCRGCHNCFGCVGLRNKSHCIFNKQYSKDQYFEILNKINIGSFIELENLKKQFNEFNLRLPRKYARLYYSIDSTGDNGSHLKNCNYCFDALGKSVEDSRYVCVPYGKFTKDSHSVYGIGDGELSYESISIRQCNNILFSKKIWGGHHCYYSFNCHNTSNLFGCVGLRGKQYCILNKQYTKEEYEKLVPQIIKHMDEMPYVDKGGRIYKYGEFFPAELSPFAYNESKNQEFYPLTKQQAIEQGYSWKDSEQRSLKPTIHSQQLPDHIKDVDDSILSQVIQCQHTKIKEDGTLEEGCNEQCTTAFKIIPQELDFYRKMNLPLPRLCPNCRHYQRLKQRNPLKLWKRKCMCAGTQSENGIYKNTVEHIHGQNHCDVEFETAYAPDRPEIVYCEKCYNAEVV